LAKLRKIVARIAVPQHTIVACIKATLPFTVQQINLVVQYIMHRQYTTNIKQDSIITKLADIWLNVSAVTGHLQAN
jgi:hypothetical protein